MTTPTDPRVVQALDLFARVGDLLDRSERIVRSAEPSAIARFDLIIRSLMQAQHAMALAWRNALCNVPMPAPKVAEVEPEVPTSVQPSRIQQPTPAHPLAQKILAD